MSDEGMQEVQRYMIGLAEVNNEIGVGLSRGSVYFTPMMDLPLVGFLISANIDCAESKIRSDRSCHTVQTLSSLMSNATPSPEHRTRD